MPNDEAPTYYCVVKRLVEAMTLRDKVLEEQMAELDANTVELDGKIAARSVREQWHRDERAAQPIDGTPRIINTVALLLIY